MKAICMLVLTLAFVAGSGGCRGEVDLDENARIAQPQ